MVNQTPLVSLTKSLSRNMYFASRRPQCTQEFCEKHGATALSAANRSAVRRRVCLMCYQTAWMKSREPFDGPFAQKVRATGTDQQKMLMGAIEKW